MAISKDKLLKARGYKVVERQTDCFGKWNCTIYGNEKGDRIYHQKYQGWYDSNGEVI